MEDTKPEEENNSSPLIDNATAAAAELRKANEVKKELLDREEALQARKELGGTTEAGTTKEEPVEISPKDSVEKVMAGEVPDGTTE